MPACPAIHPILKKSITPNKFIIVRICGQTKCQTGSVVSHEPHIDAINPPEFVGQIGLIVFDVIDVYLENQFQSDQINYNGFDECSEYVSRLTV